MPQNLIVTRTADFTGSVVRGLYPARIGKTFYVNSFGGSDTHGLRSQNYNYPMETIEGAVALCTNDADDYIFVIDCYDADTYTITVNKSRVHIVGISLPTPWSYATLDGGGDNIFTLTNNYIEIAGFSLISAGANGIVPGNNGYHWIHNVNFAVAAASLAIGITGAGAFGTNSMIEDCYFGYQAANITTSGIVGGLTQSTIRNCVFQNIASKCIHLNNNNCRILHNYFFAAIASAEAAGWAVHLDAGSLGNIVMENFASQAGNGATGDNPYRDQTSASAATMTNGWAANFDGAALTAGPDGA